MNKLTNYVAAAFSALTMTASAGELAKKVAFTDVGVISKTEEVEHVKNKTRTVLNAQYTADNGLQIGYHGLNDINFSSEGAQSDTFSGNNRLYFGDESIPVKGLVRAISKDDKIDNLQYGVRTPLPFGKKGFADIFTDGKQAGANIFALKKAGSVTGEALYGVGVEDGQGPKQLLEFTALKDITGNASGYFQVKIPGGFDALINNYDNLDENVSLNAGIRIKW
jgi:hypothetical protein